MPSSDINTARGEAREAVMEHLALLKLVTNNNKQYTHDEIMKVLKIIM